MSHPTSHLRVFAGDDAAAVSSESVARAQRFCGPMTVFRVAWLYLQDLDSRLEQGAISRDYYRNSRDAIEGFARRYGHQRLDQCKRHDLGSWLKQNPQWTSNHTKKRILGAIIRAFLWCEEEELIDFSPYRKPKKMKLPTKPRRTATDREYVQLMRCPSRALRRALFFLRRTGARTCEMRELEKHEVCVQDRYIEMLEHKTDDAGDDVPPRIIGLDKATARFLGNLIRKLPHGQTKVFCNADKKRPGPWGDRHVFARHFRRWADRLGLASDLSAYCFRHYYTTTAVEANLPDRAIADQLGHKSTRMVSWYAKTIRRKKHLKRVAAKALRRRRRKRKDRDERLPLFE